jgi:lipoprotein-releasing system permease protein
VLLTVTASSGGSTIEVPDKLAFRYADDSRTGIYEIDSQHVYCGFDLLQKLVQMDAAERVNPETGETVGTVPARCSQIQIKTIPGLTAAQINGLCRRMEETYHGYLDDPRFELDAFESRLVSDIKALTWQESQIHIIGPVEKERILVTILFGIISLVAVTLVLCILYMIVLQKTRDIGIVKSIGGSSGGVAFIFIMYGAAVGIAGSILGTVFGTLFVTYINEFQDFLIQINPAWRVWDLQVYSFDRIPSEVDVWDAITIVIVAIITSTLGSLVAAWRAGSMQPVEAVRYE